MLGTVIWQYQYSDSESAPTTIPPSTHDQAASTIVRGNGATAATGSSKDRESDQDGLNFKLEWLTFIAIGIILIIIIMLLLTARFLHMPLKSRKRNVIIPQCVQTVEQTLMIKVKQPKAVKEKETSLDEDSKHSLIQVELDQKLPDTISSRTNCTQL